MAHIKALSDGNILSSGSPATVEVPSMHIGGVYLQANAANSASIVLRRDSASGQIIFDMALNATSGGPMSRYVSFNPPLSMEETTTLHWALASGSGTSEAMIYEYVE